jgi:hypothetical protein
MSTFPRPPFTTSPAVPNRRVPSVGTFRPHCRYRQVTAEETFPLYESLAPVVEILADVLESPVSWARSKLRHMTGRDLDWKVLKSSPPNRVAEDLALRVLKAAHSLRPLEPSVTASAEGGIGIVYKSERRYAAIECLNSRQLWMLWFDSKGEPQSRRVKRKEIDNMLRQIAEIHADA